MWIDRQALVLYPRLRSYKIGSSPQSKQNVDHLSIFSSNFIMISWSKLVGPLYPHHGGGWGAGRAGLAHTGAYAETLKEHLCSPFGCSCLLNYPTTT
jgi:hypothetical protein